MDEAERRAQRFAPGTRVVIRERAKVREDWPFCGMCGHWGVW